ncbi:MAG: hypothetical protein AAFU70_11705 [Planctomycetota bacterium]
MFCDAANASGLASPTRNVFSIRFGAAGQVFVADGSADAVFVGEDRNDDRDAQDAGGARVRFSSAKARGLPRATPNGVVAGADGAIHITNAGTSSSPT